MNEKVVMVSNDYDRIDGRNAYQSDIKCLTLGAPMREENKKISEKFFRGGVKICSRTPRKTI